MTKKHRKNQSPDDNRDQWDPIKSSQGKKPLPIYIPDDSSRYGQSQISIVQKRGLSFNDDEVKQAQLFLQHNLFYRLNGYLYIMEDKILTTDGQNLKRTYQYPQGLTFSEIHTLYRFDKRLRSLLLEALEDIENSLKTVLCNEFIKILKGHKNFCAYNVFNPDDYDRVANMCRQALKKGKRLPYPVGELDLQHIEIWK